MRRIVVLHKNMGCRGRRGQILGGARSVCQFWDNEAGTKLFAFNEFVAPITCALQNRAKPMRASTSSGGAGGGKGVAVCGALIYRKCHPARRNRGRRFDRTAMPFAVYWPNLKFTPRRTM